MNLHRFPLGWSFAAALLVAACSGESRDRPASPRPTVTVAVVAQKLLSPQFHAIGRIEAVESVAVRARVTGVLVKSPFREGAAVKQGDVLFEIERRPFEVAVAAARAAVTRAQADEDKASQYLQRLDAVREGGVSPVDLEAARADAKSAAAQTEEAQAALDHAELELGYTRITSPIDGRTGKAAATPGNLIGPDSGPLLVINQLDPVYATYSAAQADYLRIARARAAKSGNTDPGPPSGEFVPRLVLGDDVPYETAGRVLFVDNKIDAATGTVQIRAEFDNPGHILLPGQFVSVVIERSVSEPLMVVPQVSVLQNQAGHYVLVVDAGGNVSERAVTVGDRRETWWIIRAGLQLGEQVIVDGAEKVQPGVAVAIVPASLSEKEN